VNSGKQWAPRLFAAVGYAVFTSMMVIALLECGAFVVLSAYHWVWPDTEVNFAEHSPAYRGYSWAPEFWKEEKARWRSQHGAYEPFRIWGVAPWHSEYINTDDSENGSRRRTINPQGCAENTRIDVWMFGGSTLFGTGVPDWATIPSFLSHDLNSSGVGCVVVTNFGTEGYVTNQELILLIGHGLSIPYSVLSAATVSAEICGFSRSSSTKFPGAAESSANDSAETPSKSRKPWRIRVAILAIVLPVSLGRESASNRQETDCRLAVNTSTGKPRRVTRPASSTTTSLASAPAIRRSWVMKR
jgi:hypothetical protein